MTGPASRPSDLDAVRALAAAHLPPDIAERWLGHLRPAVRLEQAAEEDPGIAHFGGVPVVPAGFEWPQWPGHGPLAYLGEIDLDALHTSGLPLDIALPSSGRLLAFYFDGSYDDYESIVGIWAPESRPGARIVHVREPRAACTPAPTPPRVKEFGSRRMAGRSIMTWSGSEHPALNRALGADEPGYRELRPHPVNSTAFQEALTDLRWGQPYHQIGGWAHAVQAPPEAEVASYADDEDELPMFESGGIDYELEALQSAVVDHDSVRRREDATLAWTLLLQIDWDGDLGMEWSDSGVLYWLVPRDNTPADPLASVTFTWQQA